MTSSSSSSSGSSSGIRFRAQRREQYSLYRARLVSRLQYKNLWSVCDAAAKSVEDRDADVDPKVARSRSKAVHVIMASLGNTPLAVIETAIGMLATMFSLLDEIYASTRAASRISLITELYRLKFSRGSIAKHCDRMLSILTQLEKMGKDVPSLNHTRVSY